MLPLLLPNQVHVSPCRSLRRLRTVASHLPSQARLYSSLGLSPRKTFTLNTGDKIPAIGLGTWQSKPNEVGHAVEWALRKGYRHIDTAVRET